MILAIDPGTTHSAYLFMGGDGSIRDFDKGCINQSLLSIIRVREYQTLVIEEVQSYMQRVGKSVFETIRWYGRFEEAAYSRLIPAETQYVGRKDVCRYWIEGQLQDDTAIRAAMIEKYGDPGTAKKPGPTHGITSHAWSALAIAGYWHAALKANLL